MLSYLIMRYLMMAYLIMSYYGLLILHYWILVYLNVYMIYVCCFLAHFSMHRLNIVY